MSARQIASVLGFAIGLFALILQFCITVPLRMDNGDSLVGAIVFFFTFFTILTNIMLVLIHLSELVRWHWLGWWRSPVTRGTMFAAIALVMGFYHLILAESWNPQGLAKVADVLLHYVTPTLYMLWWLAFQPKGKLRLGDLVRMFMPPVAWLVWAMLRGAVIAEYPYPILEAHRLGYAAVALNIAIVVLVLLVLFVLTIVLDRLLARTSRAAAG